MSLLTPLETRNARGRRRHLEVVPDYKPQQSEAEVLNFPATEAFQRFTGKVSVAGATAHYAHFRSANPLEETPVQVVNGFMGTQGAYEAFGAAMASSGRNVTILNPTRHQKRLASLHHKHLMNVLLLPAEVNHKVAQEVADRWGYSNVDLIGHSMGNDVAAEYAAEKPYEVRSVMSTGPAGLDGPAGVIAMLGRLGTVIKHEIWADKDLLLEHAPLSIIPETAFYMFRHPGRTIREGVAAATRDARPDLLKAKEHGVRLGLIAMEADLFFDPSEIYKQSGHLFDWSIQLDNANHIHPQTHPKEHALVQIQGLQELNNVPGSSVLTS